MEKYMLGKMLYRSRPYRALPGILILVMLAGCGEQAPERAERTEVEISIRAEIELPDDFSPRMITSAARRDSCHIAFVEHHSRTLYRAGVCEPGLEQIAGRGTGHHEYERPYRVFDLDGKLGLSDRNRSEFIIYDEEDEFFMLIPYEDAPARLFTYRNGESVYYHTDSGMYLMRKSELMTEDYRRFFLLPAPFQALSVLVPGGGIQRIGDRIFTMSSLMPYIYIYDIEQDEVEYLLPDFMRLSNNTREIADIEFEQQTRFMEELHRYQQYLNLLALDYRGEPHLLVVYAEGGDYLVAVLTPDGETLVNQPLDYIVTGTFGDALIGMDLETERLYLLDIE